MFVCNSFKYSYRRVLILISLLLIMFVMVLLSCENVTCVKLILGLASKVKRSDSLALKLRGRPSREELEGKNIIPSKCDRSFCENCLVYEFQTKTIVKRNSWKD